MTRDDLAWGTVTPRKCLHKREWRTYDSEGGWTCRCGWYVSGEAVRRARNNRKRGNKIELKVSQAMGLPRVGQFGGPTDAGDQASPFIVQVKSGGSFPERIWRWLKALPSNANQTPIVVVTDAPGPGHRRRALVVLTLEDWVQLHGPLE